MSKLFKRLLCLLLGIIIGVSATVGSIATSVFYLYGNLTVSDVLPEDKDRLKDALGDLGNYSADDLAALITKALKAPQNYTIEDLERDYGFNLVDLINQAAGSDIIDTNDPSNKPYINDLKSISLFSLLSGQVNVKEFLSEIPLGAFMSFIPADTILDHEQREKLRKYSLGSLLAKDENTELPVIIGALSDLTIGGILPGMFEKVGDKYEVRAGKPLALNLVANLKLGGILNPLVGSSSFGDELVTGGLSSIGELTLGEIYRSLGIEEDKNVSDILDGVFTGDDGEPIRIRDLFAKDITSGDDHYVFVIDKLLDSIRFGTLFGLTKKGGYWYVTQEDGTDVRITGLLEFLADLNLTDVYHALTDAGSTSDKIHKIILIFGDLTVGDVFESLGYGKDADGNWIKPDGTKFESKLLANLLDFSVKDLVGSESQDLTLTQIRKNVIGAVADLSGDLSFGEGLGELFGIEYKDGVYYKDGSPVNDALTRLLDIKVRDFVSCFGKDEISLDEIYGVVESAAGGLYIGSILGAERIDGYWYKDGERVDDVFAVIYDLRVEGLFSLIKELTNPDTLSYSEIIKGFMPETCIGDFVGPLLGFTKIGVGDSAYFVDKEGNLVDGISKFLKIRLWQIAAAFDKNGSFDIKAELEGVRLGDLIGATYDEENNTWTLGDRVARDGLADLLNVSLDIFFSGDADLIKDTLTDKAMNVSLGSLLSFALAYDAKEKTVLGDTSVNDFICRIFEWDKLTTQYVTDLIDSGDTERLRQDLIDAIGDLDLGEAFRPYITDIVDGKYTFTPLKELAGLLDPLFNTKNEVYINFIFDLINGNVNIEDFIKGIYGDLTIGELLAPVLNMKLVTVTGDGYDNGKEVYVLEDGNGKSLGTGITDLLKTSVYGLVQSVLDFVLKDEGKSFTYYFFAPRDNATINVDHMIGDYVYTFLNLDYDAATGKWKNSEGEEIYAPLGKLISANVFDILDHILDITRTYTDKEKEDYFYGLVDDITVKDTLSFSDDLVSDDKYLIKKVGDVGIAPFIRELMASEDILKTVRDSKFGKVETGDIVQYFASLRKDEDGWISGDHYIYTILSDLFDISVENAIDIVTEFTSDVKGGVIKTAETILKHKFYEYVIDFGYDMREKHLFDGISNVIVSDFVKDMLGDDALEKLKDPYFKDVRIIDIVELFTKIDSETKPYVGSDGTSRSVNEYFIGGKTLGLGISALLDAKIVGIINIFTTSDGTVLDRIEKAVSFDFMVGDYLTVMDIFGISYEKGKWVKAGEEIYAPLGNLCSVYVSDILDHLLGDYTNDEKIEYIINIFDNLTVRDFMSLSDDLANIDKILLQDYIYDIVVADVLKDIIVKKTAITDVVRKYLGDIPLGAFANLALDTKPNGDKWTYGSDDMPYIASDVFNVTINDILDIVDEFTNNGVKSGISKAADIFGHTFREYVLDFGYDLNDNHIFVGIKDVKVSTFIKDMLGDDALDKLEEYFKDARVGDIAAFFVAIERDETGWKKSDGNYLPVMLGDIFDITVKDIRFIVDKVNEGGSNAIVDIFNKIFPERRVGDLINMIILDLRDDCVRGKYTNVWGMNKTDGDLPLILSDVFNLKFATIFDAILGTHESAADIVLSITDEIFGDPINNRPEDASWARSFNDYMLDLGLTYLDDYEAFAKIKDEKVGEFIYHILKDEDPVEYLKGLVYDITLGQIAEIPLGSEGVNKLPLIVRDVFKVTVGDIIDTATQSDRIKTNVCKILNKITDNDADGHHLGDYIDDILKGGEAESVIKKNLGLKGITDIKIAELVSVILKEKTDIKLNKDGTLAKFDLESMLPAELRDLIVYICDNITDPVLIGDFLRNTNGIGGYKYDKEAGKWYDADGKECSDILNQLYSCPTTYILLVIGGIYVVATDPQGVIDMLMTYKVGTVLMPIYNEAFKNLEGFESEMTCTGENEADKVYTINGLFKDLLTGLSNYTFGEIRDNTKENSMWIAEYFYNRRLGDILYEPLAMFVGDFLKLDGFACNNKAGDGDYETEKKVIAAVFNINVYDLIHAEDKVAYIKNALRDIALSDLLAFYDGMTSETKAYEGSDGTLRSVNEYFFGGKTLGLGISALLDAKIVGIIDIFTTSDGTVLDRIEKAVSIDYMLGDYLTVMDLLGLSYESGKWVKDGKEVYAPLGSVYSVYLGDLLDHILGDYSAEEKRNYIIRIFDKLTVRDFMSISDDLANIDKILLQDYIYDIVVADLIIDLIDKEDKLAVVDDYFGDIPLGAIINLAMDTKPVDSAATLALAAKAPGSKWTNGAGEMPLIVSDVFNVTVSDILDIADAFTKESVEAGIKSVANAILVRTFDDYSSDFGFPMKGKTMFEKLADKKVCEFVSELIDAEDKVEYIKKYFDDVSIGEIAKAFADDVFTFEDVTPRNWSINGTKQKLIVSDLLNIKVSKIFEIIDAFTKESVEAGIKSVANAILVRTFDDYSSDFGFPMKGKTMFEKLADKKVCEFVSELIDAEDKVEYIKKYFDDVSIGEIAKAFADDVFTFEDVTPRNWSINGTKQKLIVSDLLNVKISQIFEIIDEFTKNSVADGIKATANAILVRTFDDYSSDFGFPMKGKTMFEKLADKKVCEFVSELIDAEDKVEYIKKYFDDVSIGEIAKAFADDVFTFEDVTPRNWSINGTKQKLIVSDLLNVKISQIFEIIDEFTKNSVADGIKATANAILVRTFDDYSSDFGFPMKGKTMFEKLADKKVCEFVSELIDAEDKVEYIKKYFDDVSIGEIAKAFADDVFTFEDATPRNWSINGTKQKLIVSDLLNVKISQIFEIIDEFTKNSVADGIKATANAILVRTFDDYSSDFGFPMKGKTMFEKLADKKVCEFVSELIDAEDKVEYIKKYFDDVSIGEIAKAFADDVFTFEDVTPRNWSINGTKQKLIVSDLLNVKISQIFEIIDKFTKNSVADGIKATANAILVRTFDDYSSDFGFPMKGKTMFEKLADKKVCEFVSELIDAEDKVEYIKKYFDDVSIGEIAKAFADDVFTFEDVTPRNWSINGTKQKLIVSDLLNIKVSKIFEIIDAFTKEGVKSGISETSDILVRTFYDYVKDFGYDLNDNNIFDRIKNVVVGDFVKEMLEGDALDKLEWYFEDARIGDIVSFFVDIESDENGWMKPDDTYFAAMIGDLLNISVGDVRFIVEKAKEGTTDAFVKIFNRIFPERRVGDLINVVIPTLSDDCVRGKFTNVWGMNKTDGDLPLILSDVFNLKFATIFNAILGNHASDADMILSMTDEIFGDPINNRPEDASWARTFNDYMKDLGLTYLEDYEAFAKIRDEKVGEFIYHLLKDEYPIDYIESLVHDITLGQIAEIPLGSEGVSKLPLIVRDVFKVTLGDIITTATHGDQIKANVCKILNKITDNDADGHHLGDYIDDILKGSEAESVIKKNLGLKGITDIKIAELVSVILKEKTGIKLNKDGTLAKFNLESMLPAELRDLIVYICDNITDPVLIGDFLRNTNGIGGYKYDKEAGKWYDADGNECSAILSQLYSYPTTYILLAIGGAYVAITDPQSVVDMIMSLKVGTVVMPVYNEAFKNLEGFESEMTCTGENEADKVYTVSGVHRDFLTELSNYTFKEIKENVDADGEWLVKYYYDRQLGDLIYDPLAMYLGKNLGLEGFAYENKGTDDKYDVSKNLLTAVFNFNVYEYTKSDDKVGYLKKAFENITFGDLLVFYGGTKVTEKSYVGADGTTRTVNEYAIGETTLGLGVSGLIDAKIVGIIDIFVTSEGTVLDRIEKAVSLDYMLGDYLTVADMLGLSYNGSEWIRNGKAVYAPVGKVFDVYLGELLDYILGDHTAEEKREYIRSVFGGLTVRDFVSISDDIANIDKILLQDYIYDIVVADFVIDLIETDNIKETLLDYFGDIPLGAIANLVIDTKPVDAAATLALRAKAKDTRWTNGTGNMLLIVSDVFNVTVNNISFWVDAITDGLDAEAIVDLIAGDVFGTRTIKEYLEDIGNETVTKIVNKAALKKLVADETLVMVIDEIMKDIKANEPVTILTHYFGDAKVGELVQIALDDLRYDGTNWVNGATVMKLIVTDLFNVSVNDIGNWFNAIKDGEEYQKVVDLIAGDVFGTRTIKEYLEDIGNETVTKIVNKAALKKLVADETLVMVIDEIINDIKANNAVAILTHYFGDAKIGELVQIALDDLKYDGTNWVNGATVMKLIVTDLFNISVNDIGNWFNAIKDGEEYQKVVDLIAGDVFNTRTIKEYLEDIGNETVTKIVNKAALKKLVADETLVMVIDEIINDIKANNAVAILTHYFGDAKIGELVQIALDDLKYDGTNWVNGETVMKLIVTDLFNVSVNDIGNWFNAIKDGEEYQKVVDLIAGDVFNTRTIKEYLEDIGNETVTKIVNKAALKKLVADETLVMVIDEIMKDIKANEPVTILTHYFGDAKVGELVQIALDDLKYDGTNWVNGATVMKLIVTDLFNVSVNDIGNWFNAIKDGEEYQKVVDLIAGDVFGTRTIKEYLEDIGNETVTKIVNKAALKKLVADETLVMVIDEIINDIKANNAVAILTHYFGDAKVGELVQIALDDLRYDGTNWVNGATVMKLIVTDLFNVSVNDIGNWFNAIKDGEEYQKVVDLIAGDVFGTRTIKEYLEDIGNETVTKIVNKAALKKLVADETLVMVIDEIIDDIKANNAVAILTHYFGDAKVGELVQIALDDLKYDGTNWVNGATVMKLIVTDLFNVSVNDIGNWFNAIKDGEKAETIIRTIVKDIADGRYLNDYLADIGNETINRVIAKDALDKLLREETVVMVTDEIIGRVQKGDYLGLVVYYFGDIKIGQFAQLFDGRFTEEKDVWSHNGNKVKLIVTDLFNITVNNIEGWRKTIFTDNNYKKAIKDIASDVFGERTFEDYTKDFGLNIISEKALFEVIRETKVSEFVQRLVDAETTEDRLDYLRTFIMGVKIGAIAEVAGVADSPNGGDKWTTSDKKEITYALSDLLDLTFDDIIDMFFARKGETLPSWQNRVSTLVSKYTKADKHTLKVYIEDAVGKAINVKGLADLSDIRIAELVAVALKVKTDVIADENGTLVKFNAVSQLPEDFKQLIIYVCNITDKVLIGDYLTKLDNVTGGVYRDNDGKWFNKTEEVTGILKTIYDIPTTYLFGVILAIAQPQLILDAIGGYKIGQIIQKPYNEALTYFNSAIRNNKSDYYVEGSFKEVMEEFVNISVLDIYNDIKDGKFIENVKNKFVLDREVGDYLFDVIAQLAKKASKLNSGLDGYAYENVNETTGKYELNGNFKVVYETILNLRFKEDMIDQGKNIGTHLKEIFEKLYLGDIFYDLARHVSKGKICEGYAFENFASHGDKFELEKSLAAVISATFNIQIADITKCFKGNVGVNFKKLFEDAYTGLTVGDFTYDLFRKFVAKKLSLSAKGYAYDYKKDNTLLQGKIAKLMRATFNIKLGDLNNLVKDFAKPEGRTIKTIILDFASKIYGNLEIGDVIGAVMEKLTATKLQMVYEYDEEYNLTVKGNFKEIANSVYSEKLANLIAAVKENTVRTYFIGDKEGTTDGVVGKHIAGDLFGYILKSKAFKGFTKYTTVERDDNANEWIAEKAFSHPINILFNDLTISALLRGMDHPRSFLIKHFGNVLLGELLGKYRVDNVWYMVDGKQEEMTAENGGVIMKHVYEITFEQILDEDFNINTAIADIYVGELIGYSHCGKKYTKTDEKHSAYILCKVAEHVDNADGYHIHADECNVSGHDHGANTYEPGWYKTTGGVVSEVGAVEGVMADMRLGHILGNQNFSCGDLFGDMRIGEVLDYKYCDKNGASGKCTVESHTDATHNARTSITWYVKDGATYKMAGALERTIANVKMKDILNGSFDVDATLKTLKLGNLMNYEYCDGAMDSTECFLTHTHRQGWYQLTDDGEWKLISREFYCDGLANSKHCAAELNHDHTSAMVYKAGWYHMEDGSWIINYEGDATSEGKRMNNNIMLCIFDYSMDGLRGNDFSKDLIDSINVKVLIGDIYDPSTATGPLKLVSPNTPIGEISTAIETAMDTATAKELKDCGLLPIKEDTGLKMNTIYGATLMMSYDTTTGTWKPSTNSDGIVAATGTEAEANAALAAHNIADYGGDYVAYEKAVGETYWNSLTIDKLVNVLLTRVESL